jgi:hypothetical protein
LLRRWCGASGGRRLGRWFLNASGELLFTLYWAWGSKIGDLDADGYEDDFACFYTGKFTSYIMTDLNHTCTLPADPIRYEYLLSPTKRVDCYAYSPARFYFQCGWNLYEEGHWAPRGASFVKDVYNYDNASLRWWVWWPVEIKIPVGSHLFLLNFTYLGYTFLQVTLRVSSTLFLPISIAGVACAIIAYLIIHKVHR